ncbi:hypothetical protein [Pseudonocardia broussonetiae]|uniref:Uncharacterized protein n=1 Tax=Pseudonocardia broussonetiae TaxID=2736640 RepID=A0A6M6JUR2_9PSEU|nr:hypothetical protein [Pseudonocardia broussonetiae]QJY51230.1 hypothetical protein HOP40_35200 [Pseudonocardia broussonetiae]
MNTITLQNDGAGPEYVRVTFRYDPVLVEVLKAIVPAGLRRWDGIGKAWSVHRLYVDQLAAWARQNGHAVADIRPTARTATPPSAAGPRVDWAEALFAAVGPDRADAAFKALTRVLHPDLPTGDTRLMQDLNRARGIAGRAA